MVPLIVECCVPFEMAGSYLQSFRQGDGLGAEQVTPACGGIEAQPLGVLPAQGVDGCPDIPPVSVHLLGYPAQRKWLPGVGEQPMVALLFYPRAGAYVLKIA